KVPGVPGGAVTQGRGMVAGPWIVPAVKPVGPARIAAGPRSVIVELAIADRDLGPGIEVRAPPRDHDPPGPAAAVRNDRRGRLDDGAASGALDDRLRRQGLLFGGVGGHDRGANEDAKRSGNKRTRHY